MTLKLALKHAREILDDNDSSYKFVASKRSDYFHYISCKYAWNIKKENLVLFESREEATDSGRTLARCCNH